MKKKLLTWAITCGIIALLIMIGSLLVPQVADHPAILNAFIAAAVSTGTLVVLAYLAERGFVPLSIEAAQQHGHRAGLRTGFRNGFQEGFHQGRHRRPEE